MNSNEGQTGVESIRIGGNKIDELPIAEAAITKQQWPDIIKASKDNVIENVKARYPKQTIAWIAGAIRECNDSIKRVRNLAVSQQKMIDDYLGHISLCEYRDKEICRTEEKYLLGADDADIKQEIKELKLRFPPYNVDAMRIQIKQCREAIERSNEVIDKEHDSISKLKELHVQCTKRDNELRELGEKV